jgi:hypothetical protein
VAYLAAKQALAHKMNTALLPTRPANRRRWMALVVVCLAQLMIVLDSTIPVGT